MRWVLSSLRGRGGCYKHSFYGIRSELCMEGTTSLACANRCTFCWRHSSHPVALSWKFREEGPEEVLSGMLEEHRKLLLQYRGVHGVNAKMFEKALKNPRHCALSLVGEPLLYPRIGEFVRLLHQERISSFLVTNGQFPEQLKALAHGSPVTQLYVSVDAADPDSLRKVDRPVFVDYWERLLESLDAIGGEVEGRQRSVCRLTLLKGKNMSRADIDGYVSLILRAKAHFVELKGATFAGWDKEKTGLTIDNTPWFVEVEHFAGGLLEALEEAGYGLASVHEHSCSILLARKDLYCQGGTGEGGWRTWIDFEKFLDLANENEVVSVRDFQLRTPPWALPCSPEKGFNPEFTGRYAKRGPRKVPERILKELEEKEMEQDKRRGERQFCEALGVERV